MENKTSGYAHLSKSQIIEFVPMMQMYAFGNNAGGRPEGIWIAHDTDWLQHINSTNDPEYNSYQYLYEIKIMPSAKIFVISRDNFNYFDRRVPDYWLNFDYFDIDIKDVVSGRHYRHSGELKFDFNALTKRSGETLRDILTANKIIFNTIEAARTGCKFYSTMGTELIERFKYKNWSKFAEEYSGVYFSDYSRRVDDPLNKYFWYQTLDIPSGCIWDKKSFTMNLAYKLKGKS
jgi:hypothetical protein